jgi:hypothetical protein
MDRCPECEKQERAAEEAERVERNHAFAEKQPVIVGAVVRGHWTDDGPMHPLFPLPGTRFTRNPELLPCGCDKPHKSGASFFVSCIEDSGQRRNALLLGPYNTHEEALANVDRGRKLAETNDPKAHWYSFGTCSIQGPTEWKGVFGK